MRRRWPFVVLAPLLFCASTGHGLMQGTLLWRLGTINDSAAEFSSYEAANPEIVNVGDAPNSISKGLKADQNPAMQINYRLGSVPTYGAMLSFKLLHAHQHVPEMTVFANGICVGIIQLWGTGGTKVENDPGLRWRKTYQLYIPKEFLSAGANVLRLEATRNSYAGASLDQYLWWEWDYLQLEALSGAATEPLHGKMAYLGSTLTHNSQCFTVDQTTVNAASIIFKWMGIAYSNNTIRANFWSDVTDQQPNRLEYLQALRDLNLTAVSDHLNLSNDANFDGNALNAAGVTALNDFFTLYRNYFLWYELDNEPGASFACNSKERIKNVANYVNQIKPAHVKTTAPGWAYFDNPCTDPPGWEAREMDRREVEERSQALNGHTYGGTEGFIDNLKSINLQEGITDGWPREMIATETGTQDFHSDAYDASSIQTHASRFDRILRANVAVVDRAMQHAVKFRALYPEDYGLFTGSEGWVDAINQLTSNPGANNGLEDSRLQTYRRLALAYATHGGPLAYTYLNPTQVQHQKVYFRAVDTATLPPVAGSGATSDKILLNFVNFSGAPQTMRVRVTLPSAGTYHAQRIGPGATWGASHSDVYLAATPTVDINEVLPARESVQYILTRPADRIITVVAPPTVYENATGAYGIALSRQPASNVTVTVARVSGDNDITIRGSGVYTFTPSNWYAYQQVTLAAADDADAVNGAALIRASAPGYISADVNAAEAENDLIPCPWGGTNVGDATPTGSGVYALNTFIIKGAGTNIGGRADNFYFSSIALGYNATITARVLAVDNTHPDAKAGVMIREGANPGVTGARYAMMAITPGNGAVFQRRFGATGSGTETTTVAGIAAPHWVRVSRTGTLVVAARSADGLNWTRVGSGTMANPQNELYVGLAVTSRQNGTLCTGHFDQVTISHSFPGGATNGTLGAYNQASTAIQLSAMNYGGPPDLTFDYGQSGDLPLAGDWNGDGIDTVGVFRSGTFELRNSNSAGAPELTFSFGQAGDIPLAGDWDGDGVETIGVYRPSNGVFYLRNANSAGAADYTFHYGIRGDLPIVGDWDADGTDTIGVFRINAGGIGTFYLRNFISEGWANITFNFGQAGDLPVAGDWNDDGIDTIGVYRDGIFYLRFVNTAGPENTLLYLGRTGDRPIAGHWLDKPLVY